jgi:hypothetical protein
MTVGLRMFLSSAAFSIVIAVAYWGVAREPTGTLLLGVMAFGLSFVAGYMIVAARAPELWGDDAQADNAAAAGDIVGSYSIRSALPIGTAAALTFIGLGLVISPTLAALAIIALLALGALFIIQSA